MSERPKHDAFHLTSIDPRDELSTRTERKSFVYDDVNWRECIDLERTEAVVRRLNPRAKYLIFEPVYLSDSDPFKPGVLCLVSWRSSSVRQSLVDRSQTISEGSSNAKVKKARDSTRHSQSIMGG